MDDSCGETGERGKQIARTGSNGHEMEINKGDGAAELEKRPSTTRHNDPLSLNSNSSNLR